MLKRSRSARPDCDASYVALWIHLQQRYPRLRTIVIAAASSRDDAAFAARKLARAAASLTNLATGERDLGDSHLRANDKHQDEAAIEEATPETSRLPALEMSPHGLHESAGSVQIVEATPSSQIRTTTSHASRDAALTIVVAPPPQESPDCIALASTADATILVATNGRTRSQDARLAANLLRVAGVQVAAALLLSETASRHTAATTIDGTVAHIRAPNPASDGSSATAGGRPKATT